MLLHGLRLLHRVKRTAPLSKSVYCLAAKEQAPFARQKAIFKSNYLATSEDQTRYYAALIAEERQIGDCICLFGDVGAGKTAFSRAYIQAAAQDWEMPVPSPTYLLRNTYELDEGPDIHHFDLYRLQGVHDTQRIDLARCTREGVSLIEWPDRLGVALPEQRLDIQLLALDKLLMLQEQEDKFIERSQGVISRENNTEDDGEEYTDCHFRFFTFEAHGKRWEDVLSNFSDRSITVKSKLLKIEAL